MTDKLQRPESFEFALDFLGDPEASELRAYIEQLEARASLAEPAPPAAGELSDEDLGEPLGDLIDKWCQEGMQVKPYGTSFPLAHYVASRAYQYGLSKGHHPAPPAAGEVGEVGELVMELRRFRSVSCHRAADLLERQAVPVQKPAVGEIAELVAWLRRRGHSHPCTDQARLFLRAALLLERHPAPVPVAERLPGPEDCDEEHCCWRWNTIGGLWARQPLARSWYEFESHWLPAHDLPLPAGEVG